jgi:hypothetical protein
MEKEADRANTKSDGEKDRETTQIQTVPRRLFIPALQ